MSSEAEVLAEYIRNEIGFYGPLREADDLLATGVLDSFSIVSLAMFAQQRFGVEFEAEDLIRENLASLARLAELIRQRKGGTE